MNFTKLALAALTTFATVSTIGAVAPSSAKAFGDSDLRRCETLSAEMQRHIVDLFKEGKIDYQPHVGTNVVPIATTSIQSSWPGHIKYACGATLTRWGTKEPAVLHSYVQQGDDGYYYNKWAIRTGQSVVANHLRLRHNWDVEVARHNANVESQNACRATIFGTVYDICTGTVLWRNPNF